MNYLQHSTEPILIRVTSINNGITNELPVLGLNQSQVSIELAKSGLAHQSVACVITELTDGFYQVYPLASHRDTVGENLWLLSFDVTISGREVWDCMILENIVQALPDTVGKLPRSATQLAAGAAQQNIQNGESRRFDYSSPV